MSQRHEGAESVQLEALVLRDGDGTFYEVPCSVIERYRVSDERAAELILGLQNDPATSGEEWEAAALVPWAVPGGVYITTPGAASSLRDMFPGLHLRVRAFRPPRRSPIPRCVAQR